MAKKSSLRLSDRERGKRRRQDRERLQRAARELLSSEGWARWVRTRAMFHSWFRTWLKLGRCVREGETALRILAPVTVKHRDKATGEESDEWRVFFKTAFVLDVSQTELLDGAEPTPLEPPRQPVTGDSHAYLLAPLRGFTESLGYAVSFEAIEGSAGGWCDPKAKRIVVDAGVPATA